MPTLIPYERQDGRLSAFDRWRVSLNAVSLRLAALRPARRKADVLDDLQALACIHPPTDELSNRAWHFAQSCQPPWLLQHALRTYAWARLLAHKDGIPHEVETVFAAALLHDVGLTQAAADPVDGCFAVRGARAAMTFMREAGASADQANRVAIAIALHLDLEVSISERGTHAHLLQAGAALDVVGSRSRELSRQVRQGVLDVHPRLGLKQQLCVCMRREAAASPRSRMGLYVDRFRFPDLIQRAPFDE